MQTQGYVPDTSASNGAPSYPSSSKKKKNWDALAADIEKEEDKPVPEGEKDPNAGGDKALNEVFQKLYAGATDDRKLTFFRCELKRII